MLQGLEPILQAMTPTHLKVRRAGSAAATRCASSADSPNSFSKPCTRTLQAKMHHTHKTVYIYGKSCVNACFPCIRHVKHICMCVSTKRPLPGMALTHPISCMALSSLSLTHKHAETFPSAVTVTITWFRLCLNTPQGANEAHVVPVIYPKGHVVADGEGLSTDRHRPCSNWQPNQTRHPKPLQRCAPDLLQKLVWGVQQAWL
jgi:hypothetical protein